MAQTRFKLDKISPARWDSLLVPILSTRAEGSNSPTFGLFKNNGVSVAPGYALNFDGSNDYATVGGDPGNFGTSWSVDFWILTYYTGSTARYIIYKSAAFNVALSLGKIVVTLQGFAAITCPVALRNAVNNHVAITVENSTNPTVIIYIGGVPVSTTYLSGTLATHNANSIYIGGNQTTQCLLMKLDELRFYSSALDEAAVQTAYNAGNGSESALSGLLMGWHFNENTGSTCANFEGTAAYDITLAAPTSAPSFVTGIVDSGTSRGVHSYLFPPGVDTEVFCSVQLLPSYKEGSDLKFRVHWSPMTAQAATCNVRWGVEYLVKQADGTFGTTTIIAANCEAFNGTTRTLPFRDSIDYITPDISGNFGLANQLDISSVIMCRFFREGSHDDDDYNYDAAATFIDFQYQIDSIGSDSNTSKI